MSNENMVIEGGTKRDKAEKEGNITKGGIVALAAGAVAVSVTAIAKAAKPAKVIFQIGKLFIGKNP